MTVRDSLPPPERREYIEFIRRWRGSPEGSVASIWYDDTHAHFYSPGRFSITVSYKGRELTLILQELVPYEEFAVMVRLMVHGLRAAAGEITTEELRAAIGLGPAAGVADG